MHELHQTIAAGELKINASRAFALAEKGPVVILSRATPRAVLVAPDEWNHIAKRLEMLESLLEAQRIEARNDADASWVTSAEMRERLTRRGVDVGSEADDSQKHRQFHAALLASELIKQVKPLQSADRSQRRLIQV